MSDTLILNADGTPLSMMPLSVVSWETAIRLLTLEKVSVLKDHDDWVVRSPSVTMPVPSVVLCSEQIKWNRNIKYNRNNVLLRDNYTCQYCMVKFGQSNLTLDHVLPRKWGGKTVWTNVVAACKDCNSRKGDNREIVPKKMPHRPSYYELVAKSRSRILRIRDEFWMSFVEWPEDKVDLVPYKKL